MKTAEQLRAEYDALHQHADAHNAYLDYVASIGGERNMTAPDRTTQPVFEHGEQVVYVNGANRALRGEVVCTYRLHDEVMRGDERNRVMIRREVNGYWYHCSPTADRVGRE